MLWTKLKLSMNWLILPQVEYCCCCFYCCYCCCFIVVIVVVLLLLFLLFLLLLLLLFYCCCFCCFYCCCRCSCESNKLFCKSRITFTVPLILINTLGEMLTHIVERGAMFSQLDYINLLQLINR